MKYLQSEEIMSRCLLSFTMGFTVVLSRSLKRHYRSPPEHRPTSSTNVGSDAQNANIGVSEFIHVGDRYKSAGLRNLAECFTKEDALKYL